MKKKSVAIIGTNGIPAKYGGYETLTEFLVENLSNTYDFTVYCSKTQKKGQDLKEYKGAKLKYLPLNANGWQSILYDGISILRSLFTANTLVVLGGSGAAFLVFNILFRKNILLNHGGLNEWEREKYGKLGRWWIFFSRKVAAKHVTHIGDNPLIIESLRGNFHVDAEMIEYGGDHCKKLSYDSSFVNQYSFIDTKYYLCVARAQSDNNIHLLINAFKELPDKKLVVVSNWDATTYGKELRLDYKDKYENIILLEAIYDKRVLDTIRSNCFCYIHSHSYCGTAPSLTEAMSLGLPIISFDVPTNHYTTDEKAQYFKDEQELVNILKTLTSEEIRLNAANMKKVAEKRYTWKRISDLYSKLF